MDGWEYYQKLLIPPNSLDVNPTHPNLNKADALELVLLKFDQEEWRNFVTANPGISTDELAGDSDAEEWFERLAERIDSQRDAESE